VESAIQHGEQTSHLTMAPQAVNDILKRIKQKSGSPESPAVAIVSGSSRYFLRQMAEAAHCNVAFLSHNEVPPEIKVVSLGEIQ